MKPTLIIILIFCFFNLFSQIDRSLLKNAWIKTDISYADGSEVPENIAKMFNYMRYEFLNDQQLFISLEPFNKGPIVEYTSIPEGIKIRISEYQISKLTQDSLILIEKNKGGYNDNSLIYSFVKEEVFENNLPTYPESFMSGSDTIYVENIKTWAKFNKDQSYLSFIANKLKWDNYLSTGECLFATCIISKNGAVEDIVLHKGIDKNMDRRFIKAIQRTEKYMEPATLNGQRVNVLRKIYIPFPYRLNTSTDKGQRKNTEYFNEEIEQAIVESRKGNLEVASDIYKNVLNDDPENIEALYQQALILIDLGKTEQACSNLSIIKKLKSKRYKKLYKDCK